MYVNVYVYELYLYYQCVHMYLLINFVFVCIAELKSNSVQARYL